MAVKRAWTRPRVRGTGPWVHGTRIFRGIAGEVGVVLLLTLAAGALRLVALDALPPGLYRDEAYNGLDALRILRGETPIFFTANNGREPLFIYLLAAAIGVWGRSPGALRLISALMGTLTVPAVYFLGRTLFDRRVATLAGIIAITTIWTLNLSRIAFRAVLMPPVMAVSLALLWRGLKRRRLSTMAWGGLLYGLSIYTYLAARFSLIALFFFIIYTWFWHRESFWLKGWGVFALASLIVAAPLGIYLIGHWESTLGRSSQVSILNPGINGGDLWGTLARHIWCTLRGFIDRGDFIPRHNVPLRPVFTPIVSVAFWGGLGIALYKARHQARYGLCLIWLGTMLLPTILAEDAPHMLRGSGVLPVLYLFPALGIASLWGYTQRKGKRPIFWALIAGLLMINATVDLHDYGRHLRSEAVYYNFEAGATEMAIEVNRFLGEGWQGKGIAVPEKTPVPGKAVYIAPRLWRDWPSVRYLCRVLAALCPESDGLHILTNDALTMGADQGDDLLLVLWPYEDNAGALARLPHNRLISVREEARERGDLETESHLLYVTYRSHPADSLPHNIDVTWEGGIRLIGYRLIPMGDDALRIDLYWQAKRPVENDYAIFCHVIRGDTQIGQHDGSAAQGYYATDRWRSGDIIEDRHIAPLSSPYRRDDVVKVGLYRRETMVRLALLDPSGQPTQETSIRLP